MHIGHLRVAWEAAQVLDAEVHLVPANVPPHRPQPVASAPQRVAMLHAALCGQRRLAVDERELLRDGPSYTIDTLVELRGEIGPHRALVLLLGADAWAALPTWYRWRELFEYAHIGVLTRGGKQSLESVELSTEADSRRSGTIAQKCSRAAGAVIDIEVSALDISATHIRAELAAGREPRWLVPDALLEDAELLAPYR